MAAVGRAIAGSQRRSGSRVANRSTRPAPCVDAAQRNFAGAHNRDSRLRGSPLLEPSRRRSRGDGRLRCGRDRRPSSPWCQHHHYATRVAARSFHGSHGRPANRCTEAQANFRCACDRTPMVEAADSRSLSQPGYLSRRVAGYRRRVARNVLQGASRDRSGRGRGAGRSGPLAQCASRCRRAARRLAEPRNRLRCAVARCRCERDRRVDDGAVIVVENSTGDVWAYVGGAGEFSNASEFDALRALRQPGWTLKPFLYALAVDQHLLTAASLLEDSPLELSEQRGIYRPIDYDLQFRGLVSMRTALAASLNVPAVRTADMVGVEIFADYLRRLGFHGLDEEGDYYGAALALGSADVSLWELANAYRTLANGGEYSELRLTNDVNTRVESRRIYSQDAAFVISDILADRASRSTTF